MVNSQWFSGFVLLKYGFSDGCWWDCNGFASSARYQPASALHFWFLLAWKHSILSKVFFYHRRNQFTVMYGCTSQGLINWLIAPAITHPREGRLRCWEAWCQMRHLRKHSLQLCPEWGLKRTQTAAITNHQKNCNLFVIPLLLHSWWGSALVSKMSLQQ